VSKNVRVDDCCPSLSERGFVRIGDLASPDDAFALAGGVVERCCAAEGLGLLEVIGDFILPPHEGQETRDFQTLHFDFGLPLDPRVDWDVARYTALYISAGAEKVSAVTRLVPLAALLAQRTWPCGPELVRRLAGYGRTHGAWDDASGYVEGSLARLVEAAAGIAPLLPSVKADPAFLCGTEFNSLRAELEFFERHHLDVTAVQVEIALQPGELLVFDNLALAHGRRGIRRPGELRQRVFGHRGLSPTAQRGVRDRVLNAFHAAQPRVFGLARSRVGSGLSR
jgi:hypothetical protein